jgi:hypothetical protein
MPGSPLYPDSLTESMAYNLIGKISLDIKLYKYDTESNRLRPKPSLNFGTVFANPRLWYTPGNETVTMSVDELRIPPSDYSWRNQGDIQSLLDLAKGRISFGYGDAFINNLDAPAEDVCKKIRIGLFSFNIANRRFSSGKFCSVPASDFPGYYLTLPADILATHLNIPCE